MLIAIKIDSKEKFLIPLDCGSLAELMRKNSDTTELALGIKFKSHHNILQVQHSLKD